MAIARCEKRGVPSGRTKSYSGKKYLPVSHPSSGLICGSAQCRNHALVWLTFDEEEMYRKGERIFSMDTATAKIQVQ